MARWNKTEQICEKCGDKFLGTKKAKYCYNCKVEIYQEYQRQYQRDYQKKLRDKKMV